jgi:hypothetical protein
MVISCGRSSLSTNLGQVRVFQPSAYTEPMRRMMILLFGVTAFAASARAQGVGVRAGASADPDQFYAGAHVETRELAEHLRFRPNVEVGVGDGVTLVALNFEFTYRLPPAALPRSLAMWHLYVGGGPALNIFRFPNDTRSEGGFNGLVGLAHRNGLFAEAKVGALKSPGFKFGVGYTFQ